MDRQRDRQRLLLARTPSPGRRHKHSTLPRHVSRCGQQTTSCHLHGRPTSSGQKQQRQARQNSHPKRTNRPNAKRYSILGGSILGRFTRRHHFPRCAMRHPTSDRQGLDTSDATVCSTRQTLQVVVITHRFRRPDRHTCAPRFQTPTSGDSALAEGSHDPRAQQSQSRGVVTSKPDDRHAPSATSYWSRHSA